MQPDPGRKITRQQFLPCIRVTEIRAVQVQNQYTFWQNLSLNSTNYPHQQWHCTSPQVHLSRRMDQSAGGLLSISWFLLDSLSAHTGVCHYHHRVLPTTITALTSGPFGHIIQTIKSLPRPQRLDNVNYLRLWAVSALRGIMEELNFLIQNVSHNNSSSEMYLACSQLHCSKMVSF